jgi:hypothetical protein
MGNNEWAKVAVVRNRATGFKHKLEWQRDLGGFAFRHTCTLEEMGMSSVEVLDSDEVTALLEQWGQQDHLEDSFEVLEADEHLLDVLMEGREWHPLRPTRSMNDE